MSEKRRVAKLEVDPALFLDLCKATEYPRVTTATKNAIPDGAKLIGAEFDVIRGVWSLGIEHDSFEPVEYGVQVPLLPPVEVTSSLGAWQRLRDQLQAGVTLHIDLCPLGGECGWVKRSRGLLGESR